MTRTFIALEMNEAVQRHLEGIIRRVAPLLPSLRWVDIRGIHLTLAFLGELDDVQLAQVVDAAQYTALQSVSSFSYSLSSPGIFGSLRHPRVFWMGIEEPSGALQRLHRMLNSELLQRSFDVDTRPFSPHLTLARGKAPLSPVEFSALQNVLSDRQYFSAHQYIVSSIYVMKSELLRTGAQYSVIQKIPLGVSRQ
jgi:2'-5' RNA ligase